MRQNKRKPEHVARNTYADLKLQTVYIASGGLTLFEKRVKNPKNFKKSFDISIVHLKIIKTYVIIIASVGAGIPVGVYVFGAHIHQGM